MNIKVLKEWMNQKPRQVKKGFAAVLAVLAIWGLYSAVMANTAFAVVVNGREVAVIENRSSAEAVVNSLVEDQKKKVGQVRPAQEVTYQFAGFSNAKTASAEKLKEILKDELSFKTTATVIKVNGSEKTVVKDRATAEQVLEKLKQTYQVDPAYKTTFKEKVDLVDLPVEVPRVLSAEEALRDLMGESDKPRFYTVKEGDTLWDIAVEFDVNPEELQASNPGFTPETMQIGQKIKLVGVLEPVINVVATAEKTVQEDFDLPQQVRKNPKLPYGKSRVIQAGERGRKEVTYRIVAVNGLEINREVLEKKILKEGKPQIVERSSQVMIASRGISRPPGAITSPFGTRWGRPHQGIDIARPFGSPIQAVQGGKIIRAGWYGAYGLTVDINHGGGVVTRYAHLSSIGVRNGKTVQAGQVIGKAGATGRTTGPNLHFEKIINGVPRNPTV